MPIFFIFLMILSSVHANVTKKSKNPPSWMMEQIEEDLHHFKEKGISLENLDKLMEETQGEMTVRVRISSGKVQSEPEPGHMGKNADENHFFNERYKIFIHSFKEIAERNPLPDVDFVITVNDCGEIRTNPSAPLFVFSKPKYVSTHVLVPDLEILQGYQYLDQEIAQGSLDHPWENKIEKIFWRGADSDSYGNNQTENWRSSPRAKLVVMSLENPGLIDAKFSCFSGQNYFHEMLQLPLKGNWVSPKESLKYKYLIDLDGIICSWSRTYWTLLSNSLLFKQVTNNIEWYYKGLKPFEHYIPISYNLSDLMEKLQWAKTHDQEAQRIAVSATRFARKNLSKKMVDLYLYLLFTRYAELQQF